MAYLLRIFKIILLLLQLRASASQQQAKVYLEQGELVGVKVYPEYSKTAVYCYLGVPYAQPPIRELRFAPPTMHKGWNGTYRAIRTKPICPQLLTTKYDQPKNTLNYITDMDEDCLYLNIWVPESQTLRSGQLPVLVVLTGEQMSFDWSLKNVLGIDFASEGAIVVSVQYRTNIFGWLSLDDKLLAGNFALKDQAMAIKWLEMNIAKFGGDTQRITLLGHGTTGAPCALANMLSEKQQSISRLILMSGGDLLGALNSSNNTMRSSRLMLQKLGCQFEEQTSEIIRCLRLKSVNDLLKAYESVYQNGNSTFALGPALNVSLNINELHIPMLVSITSKEGGNVLDFWFEMAREGCGKLNEYLNYTIMPKVLRKLGLNEAAADLKAALYKQYVGPLDAPCSTPRILEAMQLITSESSYEVYFYDLLQRLQARRKSTDAIKATANQPNIYAYVFHASNAIDMQGKANIFGGAPHGADFSLLFGPSLFQEIARRRPTASETQHIKNLRQLFLNFIQNGNPNSNDYTAMQEWLSFTREQQWIYSLGESDNELNVSESERGNGQMINALFNVSTNGNNNNNNNDNNQRIYQLNSRYNIHLRRISHYWFELLPQLAHSNCDKMQYLSSLQHMKQLKMFTADSARYRQGFIATLALVCVLLACLLFCIYLLRRDQFLLSSAATMTSTGTTSGRYSL